MFSFSYTLLQVNTMDNVGNRMLTGWTIDLIQYGYSYVISGLFLASQLGISLCLFLCNLWNVFPLYMFGGWFFFSPSLHSKNDQNNGRRVLSQIASFTESDARLFCLKNNISLKSFRKLLKYKYSEHHKRQRKYLKIYHCILIWYLFFTGYS